MSLAMNWRITLLIAVVLGRASVEIDSCSKTSLPTLLGHRGEVPALPPPWPHAYTPCRRRMSYADDVACPPRRTRGRAVDWFRSVRRRADRRPRLGRCRRFFTAPPGLVVRRATAQDRNRDGRTGSASERRVEGLWMLQGVRNDPRRRIRACAAGVYAGLPASCSHAQQRQPVVRLGRGLRIRAG